MDVRYNPAVPITFLVIGVGNAVIGLLRLQIGASAGMPLFLGLLFGVMGLLQFTRTYFEFDPATRTIVVRSLVGPMRRRFGGAEGGTLHLDGDRVLCTRADGTVKKVPVSRFLARADQWRTVVDQVG
jgi:hypothetical protein